MTRVLRTEYTANNVRFMMTLRHSINMPTLNTLLNEYNLFTENSAKHIIPDECITFLDIPMKEYSKVSSKQSIMENLDQYQGLGHCRYYILKSFKQCYSNPDYQCKTGEYFNTCGKECLDNKCSNHRCESCVAITCNSLK